MRHSWSQRSVRFFLVLVAGLSCRAAMAQAPQQAARPAAPAAWPSQAPAANAAMPQAYSPPVIPQRLPAAATVPMINVPPSPVMQAQYPQASAGGVVPAAAVVPQPAPQQLPSSRRVQAPVAAPQALPAPGQVAPQQIMLPGGVPLTTILPGQDPAAAQQAPVIIVMPAGWDPAGGNVQFAPRDVSPEVPLEHWPMTSRNPLGTDREGKAMFKWPKIAGMNSGDDEAPAQSAGEPQVKAIFSGPAEPSAPAKEEPKAVFEWSPEQAESKALFAQERSGTPPQQAPPAASQQPMPSQQPSQRPVQRPARRKTSKSLLSIFNKKRDEAPAPAPQLVQAPAAAPQVAPAAMAPPTNVAPVTVVATQPAEAPPSPPVVTERNITRTSSAQPQLKWRAKGSPRSSSAVEVEPSVEPSVDKVALHTEPSPQPMVETRAPQPVVELTPAAPPQQTEVQPVQQQHAQQQPAAPAPQVAAASTGGQPQRPVQHKALLPLSLFGPQPEISKEKKKPEPVGIVPNLLAKTKLDNLPIRLPQRPQPRRYAAPANVAPANVAFARPPMKSLQELHPRTVHATPQPQVAVREDTPPVVAVHGAPSARATQSYYAPPTEYHVPERASARRSQAAPAVEEVAAIEEQEEQELAAATGSTPVRTAPIQKAPAQKAPVQTAAQPRRQPAATHTAAASQHHSQPAQPRWQQQQPQMQHQMQHRRFAAHDDVPPLAKPIWALSEMTKLPRFVAAVTGDPGAIQNAMADEAPCDCPQCRQQHAAQAAMVAQQAGVPCQCERCRQMRAAAAQSVQHLAPELPQIASVPAESEEIVESSRRRTKAATPVSTRKAKTADVPAPQEDEAAHAEVVEQVAPAPVRKTVPARKKTRSAPVEEPRPRSETSVVIYSEPGDGAVASDKGAPSVSRIGDALGGVRATRIRNSSGASVLIYDGKDLEAVKSTSTSTGRANPLR